MIERVIVAFSLHRVSRIDAIDSMFGANLIDGLGWFAITGFSGRYDAFNGAVRRRFDCESWVVVDLVSLFAG
jgi:hypothetical protein